MFFNCQKLQNLDLNMFKTGKLETSFSMFENCVSLKYLHMHYSD